MNCKPGEMAFILPDGETRIHGFADKVIRVLETFQENGLTYWTYEGERLVSPFYGVARGFADYLLRPIRPDESPEESTEAMRKLHELPQEVTT